MQYTLTISQTKALEWGLNAQQALLFSFVYECPSWARPVTTDSGVFFALSKAKIVEELPLLTDKPDTAYRLLKQLEAAGVIELSHTPGITLVRVTDKGKEWNKALDGSEKFPTSKAGKGRKKIRGTSEKYPTTLGKISEPGSEKSPTNQDTNNQGTNQDTSHNTPAAADAAEQAVDDSPSFDEFWSEYPRKTGKGDAEKAWRKIKPSRDLANLITKNIQTRLACGDWSLERKQYIPHPGTYLNGKRWEDEILPRTFGEQSHANQPSDRPRSAVDRVRAATAERERQRLLREGHGSPVGAYDGDLRPRMDQLVRGGTGTRLGDCIEGDFTREDQAGTGTNGR